MRQTVDALNAFFGQFGVPVWPEDSVPAGVKPPYITVQVVVPTWDVTAPFYARVWDRAATSERIMGMVDAIGAAIGEGASLTTESGCVWIHRDGSFAQRQPYPGDPTLQCFYLSMTIQAFTD